LCPASFLTFLLVIFGNIVVSIFISIASYRDPLLGFTLASAFDNAKYPSRLHFAVVDQDTMDAPYPIPVHIPSAQVRYLKIEASQSRGCCWARSVAMSLYRDEDYYLQVDSHTMFAKDWDEMLVQTMRVCLNHSALAVISSYPSGFTFVDGVAVPSNDIQVVNAVVVSPGEVFAATHPCLIFKNKKITNVGAVHGYHISAGMLFAPGKFVQHIPYDPYLYFNEEEQNMALRLYTHGWDIYHVNGVPIYHLYNMEPEKMGVDSRRLHWHDSTDQNTVKPSWWDQVERAKARMATLLWGDSHSLGQYGLGSVRTLDEYAQMCGVDYPNRTIAQKAFDGPWALPLTTMVPPPRPLDEGHSGITTTLKA
jgi:Glycosyltransferase (GlcNAc)